MDHADNFARTLSAEHPLHEEFARLAKILFVTEHLPDSLGRFVAGRVHAGQPSVVFARVIGLPQRQK
jgi:hypothetical protein